MSIVLRTVSTPLSLSFLSQISRVQRGQTGARSQWHSLCWIWNRYSSEWAVDTVLWSMSVEWHFRYCSLFYRQVKPGHHYKGSRSQWHMPWRWPLQRSNGRAYPTLNILHQCSCYWLSSDLDFCTYSSSDVDNTLWELQIEIHVIVIWEYM